MEHYQGEAIKADDPKHVKLAQSVFNELQNFTVEQQKEALNIITNLTREHLLKSISFKSEELEKAKNDLEIFTN